MLSLTITDKYYSIYSRWHVFHFPLFFAFHYRVLLRTTNPPFPNIQFKYNAPKSKQGIDFRYTVVFDMQHSQQDQHQRFLPCTPPVSIYSYGHVYKTQSFSNCLFSSGKYGKQHLGAIMLSDNLNI